MRSEKENAPFDSARFINLWLRLTSTLRVQVEGENWKFGVVNWLLDI